MEKETKRNVVLGIMVISSLVVLVTAIFLIGSHKYLFNSSITVSAYFTDLSGLQKGDNVRYGGVRVGIVSGIDFVNDTTIRVEMKIDADMKPFIHKDAETLILSEGLIGSKILSIHAGTSHTGLIADGDVLNSKDPLNTSKIMDDLVAANENIVFLTAQLAEIMTKLNQEGGLFSELAADSTMKQGVSSAIVKLNENLDAMKENVLFRAYFKRKAEAKEAASGDKKKERNR